MIEIEQLGFSGAKIEHNKIINNSTVHNGAGITIGYPQHPIIIRKNYIAHNIAKDTIFTNGGGGMMIAYDYAAYVLVAENVIEYNISYSSKGGGVGGGISMQHSNSVIRNNLIAKNIAYEGAGIHIHDGENPNKPTIINNTIVYNTASNEGGGLCVSWQNPSESQIRNCIIWGNTAPVGPQIFEYPGGYDVSVEYSNIEGGFEGNGNIDLDPLFADTTLYYLDPLSPCVDAGIPDAQYNDIEDPNNLGSPLSPALGELRNDMGCYGGQSPLNPVTDVKEITNVAGIPNKYILSQNYPNPFNPSTVIRYSIPTSVKSEKSNVKLIVFDILGREVATLVNQKQKPGTYEINFNANYLSSGVYFCKLQVGSFIETKKMILLR